MPQITVRAYSSIIDILHRTWVHTRHQDEALNADIAIAFNLLTGQHLAEEHHNAQRADRSPPTVASQELVRAEGRPDGPAAGPEVAGSQGPA